VAGKVRAGDEALRKKLAKALRCAPGDSRLSTALEEHDTIKSYADEYLVRKSDAAWDDLVEEVRRYFKAVVKLRRGRSRSKIAPTPLSEYERARADAERAAGVTSDWPISGLVSAPPGALPGRATITLTISPWVSDDTLLRAYRAAQRAAGKTASKPKPGTVRNLRIFQFVKGRERELGEMPPFPDAMRDWNRAHPDQAYTDRRRFCRDYYAAEQHLGLSAPATQPSSTHSPDKSDDGHLVGNAQTRAWLGELGIPTQIEAVVLPLTSEELSVRRERARGRLAELRAGSGHPPDDAPGES